jgi:polyhydroxybutyrate depolymerase
MRLILAAIMALSISPAWACGVKSDCKLGDRIYRIYVPERTDDKPIGAIFFAHGYKNSAAGTMSNKSLLKLADELHVALVAPQAVGSGWRLPNRPWQRFNTGKEEYAYFDKLVDEVEKRYNIDRKRLLMSGFSSGGMMVWSLACARGDLFAGFAPISGTFWAPGPKRCPSGPVNLMHFHGTTDGMVPIGGRTIADSKQGDVIRALDLFVRAGHFGKPKPMPAKALDCERRKNPGGKILEYCTHNGGHVYKASFVRRAWLAFGLDKK